MEADDFGPMLLDDGAGSLVERVAAGTGGDRSRIDAVLGVIRLEPLLPAGLAVRIRRRRLVGEEIQVERPGGALPYDADLVTDLIGTQHGAGERAKPARLAYGDCQLRSAGAGHGRQDYRQLDAEEVENSPVRPHFILPSAGDQPSNRGKYGSRP